MIDLKKHFCSVPFTFINLSSFPDFLVAPCCWLHRNLGSFRSDVDFLEEVWNAEMAQNIRQSIHDGSYKYCSKADCPHINNGSLPRTNTINDPYLRDIIDNKRIVLTRRPSILHFDHDKSCNLRCSSCRDGLVSYRSGPEYEEIKRVWDALVNEETLCDLAEINLTGAGDPFFSKVYLDFLKNLDGKNVPHLRINLFTNGVLFNQEMWSQVKGVQRNIQDVKVSLDAATESVYRNVRIGGDFRKVMQNISFLSKLKNDGFFRDLYLCFVVQDHNFRDMVDFVEMAEAYGNVKIHFQRVINWGTYSEEEFKKRAIYSSDHPDHKEFLEILLKPIFKKDFVDMGNLSVYLGSDE